MEYIFDRRKNKWYNSESFKYIDDFDASTNKNRLKIRRNRYLGCFGADYAYRDISDIKLVFNDGTLFGKCISSNCSSSFNIPGENVVNKSILKNIKEQYSYLADYIKMNRECCVDRAVQSKYYMSDEELETMKKKRKNIDNIIKGKLTPEQKLYIELNKDELGLSDF